MLEGRLERSPSGWFVVCGLQQAPGRAHGGVLSSCRDATGACWGCDHWPGLLGQPTEHEGLESRAWVLSFLNNKALAALDLSFPICKVGCNLTLQPGSHPLGSFLSLLCGLADKI